MITEHHQINSRSVFAATVTQLVAFHVGHAEPPAGDDGVRAAHQRWFDGLVAGEVTDLATLLADNMTFHSPSGASETKAHFLENIRSGRLKYESVAPEDLQV
jgi:hypothetical protein